jgi:hypothetical protein
MSRNRADSWIPVSFRTALDLPQLWGRLAYLSPSDAELVSHFHLPEGAELALDFELGGALFPAVRARIAEAAHDREGYHNYRLVILDREQSSLLRAAIAKALPR